LQKNFKPLVGLLLLTAQIGHHCYGVGNGRF
jgi:hypothetical protein